MPTTGEPVVRTRRRRPRSVNAALLGAVSPLLLCAGVLTLTVNRLGAMLDPREDEFDVDDGGMDPWEEGFEQVIERQPIVTAAR